MSDIIDESKLETIVLGGGCFWCTEAVFKMLRGIKMVEPGYAGGEMEHPHYETVQTGTTGHAETVRVTFDPNKISLDDIFTVFFATHDPTNLNGQGGDIGEQYRSIVLYLDDKQKNAAKRFIEKLNASSSSGKPIVTQVNRLIEFYRAEEYHKDYYKKHPEEAYCKVVINPKLKLVQEKFTNLLSKI